LTGELYKKKSGHTWAQACTLWKTIKLYHHSTTIIHKYTIGKEIGSKLEFLVCCLKQIKANILLAHFFLAPLES
jgi:hypothetical protein